MAETMAKDRVHEDDMMIDTSRMSSGKRQALEVAEAARDTESTKPSFAGQLFMGRFDKGMIAAFPRQSDEEKKIGDEYVAKVKDFLEKNLDPEEVDATRTIPEHVVKGLVDLGVFAMKVPKEYNGLGFSQVNYNRVMSMIASYCGSTAVLISAHQSIGVPQPLKLFGTDEQKRRYMPRFREGAISAFALTEVDVGSDPACMSTRAVLSDDGSHYVISGEKLYCTNGPIADLFVVMAQTEPVIVRGKERKQITAFIVERAFEGIEVVHRCDFMGLRGINNGLIRFNNVKVPADNILWGKGKGLKLALTTLNTGRLTIPAAALGMAKQCLRIVREWGNTRVQWGNPVGRHEAGAEKIARIAAKTFAMEAVTWLTSHWADDHSRDIRIEAAMAKLFCSETAWEIIDTTMQFRGGRGYEKASSLKARGEAAYPVERMMRECRINTIIEGTSDIMRLFLAREAMDPHLKVAADLLKRSSSVPAKMKAGLGMASFYGTWYPGQWLNRSYFADHSEYGALASHVKYVEQTAHRLARSIFHAMGMYRDRLEQKQLVLARLMEIGTELFAMAASCSYAHADATRSDRESQAAQLADLFCRGAHLRIEDSFAGLTRNDDSAAVKTASRVLDGEMSWLEEGIVPVG